jgi:hypothetical protein
MGVSRPTFETQASAFSWPFILGPCVQTLRTVRCQCRFGIGSVEPYVLGSWLTYPPGLPVPPRNVFKVGDELWIDLFGPQQVSQIEFFGSPGAIKDRRWIPLAAGDWPVT